MAVDTSPSCTILLPLYRAWGRGIEVVKEELDRVLEAGEAGFDGMRKAMQVLQEQRRAFMFASQKIERRGKKECVLLEGLAIDLFERFLPKLSNGDGDFEFACAEGHVIGIQINGWHEKQDDLMSLIDVFPHLVNLQVTNSAHLTHVDHFPPDVRYLTFSNCHRLSKLGRLPDELLELRISRTQIKEIDSFPKKLRFANLDRSKIENIPSLPDSLAWLYLNFTPASKEPTVQAQLHAFEQSHKGVHIEVNQDEK